MLLPHQSVLNGGVFDRPRDAVILTVLLEIMLMTSGRLTTLSAMALCAPIPCLLIYSILDGGIW